MLSILLAPFSWLYGAVTGFRNFLYDTGLKKSYSFSPAVVCVGNLSVGGTGKTPMIEYLVRLLSTEYAVAILSRGYGRKTQGFRLANEKDDASSLGDEPFQFYQKFKDKVNVVVCEDRVAGVNQLMTLKKSTQVILLDDAFQHRRVRPLFSILLTVFSKPFFTDSILPKGRLREARRGSSRADVIVVTKCEGITDEISADYERLIHLYSEKKPVFFSTIKYIKPVPLKEGARIGNAVVLVTGIANSKPLEDHLAGKINLRHHFEFADHHEYSVREVEDMQKKAAGLNASLVTTEKDLAKLVSPELSQSLEKKNWFYLPIESQFVNNGSEFDRIVLEKIKGHLSHSKLNL